MGAFPITKEEIARRGLICNGYHLPYNPNNIEKAKILRKNMTSAELKLWKEVLQNKHFQKLTFLRQKPIDHYIVDFYCAKLKLAIEVDGEIHRKTVDYDKERTELLQLYGVTVIRFTNEEIEKNIDEVKTKILKSIPPNPPC